MKIKLLPKQFLQNWAPAFHKKYCINKELERLSKQSTASIKVKKAL